MTGDICELTDIWMTNHFGKNPRNGGNPPKDRRLISTINFVIVDNRLNEIWLIWWLDVSWKIKIIADDIIV